MYERFFGLLERPFNLSPNPRFLYLSARQREALSNLRYGLTTPRGLTLLVGEAGSGKTTLLQAVISEIDSASIATVLVSNPTLTRAEFYEHLSMRLGLSEGAAVSKARFLFELQEYLLKRASAGQLTALILDEAQSVPPDLLEEVRLLSNMETTTTKLLNVVLAGQPELADRLNAPALRPLKQRISLRCELSPLNLVETASYIAGRVRIAGGSPSEIFTREAVELVHAGAGGLPRLINVICDNALIGGFAAEVKPITRSMVQDVLEDFDLGPRDGFVDSSDTSQAGNPSQPAAVSTEPLESAASLANNEAPIFTMFHRKRRFSFF